MIARYIDIQGDDGRKVIDKGINAVHSIVPDEEGEDHYVLRCMSWDGEIVIKPTEFAVAHSLDSAKRLMHDKCKEWVDEKVRSGEIAIEDIVDNTEFAHEVLPRGGK